MVIDGRIACIGTFNFDPRSQNLNTEVGAIIPPAWRSACRQRWKQTGARRTAGAPATSPMPLTKRGQQLLPLKPLL